MTASPYDGPLSALRSGVEDIGPRKALIQPGQRFGRLTVLREVRGYRHERSALCRCDCGNQLTVRLSHLTEERGSGYVRSCGCLKRTHGLSDHPTYPTHRSMMSRCHKQGADTYRWYGGRGIKVCERWHDVALFIEDIEREIGPRPEGITPGGRPAYTLNRVRNAGNYEPGNVRWATWLEQARSSRPKATSARADALLARVREDGKEVS